MNAKDCEQCSSNHPCCTCENLKVHTLEKRIYILQEAVDYLNLWLCPKCGHYSMPDFVCHNCGYDRSVREDLDGR